MFIVLRIARDSSGKVMSMVSVCNRHFKTENDAVMYACELQKSSPETEHAVFSFQALVTCDLELKRVA